MSQTRRLHKLTAERKKLLDAHYADAIPLDLLKSEQGRRQFNQAFFRQILIDDEYTVTDEYAEPFDVLLGDDLREAAAVRASEDVRTSVEETLRQAARSQRGDLNEQRPRGPLVLVGAEPAPTPVLGGRGFSQAQMVGLSRQYSNPSGPLKALLDAVC